MTDVDKYFGELRMLEPRHPELQVETQIFELVMHRIAAYSCSGDDHGDEDGNTVIPGSGNDSGERDLSTLWYKMFPTPHSSTSSGEDGKIGNKKPSPHPPDSQSQLPPPSSPPSSDLSNSIQRCTGTMMRLVQVSFSNPRYLTNSPHFPPFPSQHKEEEQEKGGQINGVEWRTCTCRQAANFLQYRYRMKRRDPQFNDGVQGSSDR